jgi:hypothetical protein
LACVLVDFFPEHVTDPGRGVAHEHACGDFQQSACEEAAQSGRAVGEDDDGHQSVSP